MQYEIKEFNEKQIRTTFNEEENEWYFSVIDVVSALTDSKNPQAYWRKMNQRNNTETSVHRDNLSRFCHREALLTVQGIKRTTLVISKTNLPKFLSYFSSERQEEFTNWLDTNFPTVDIVESKNPAYLPQKSNIRNLIYTIRNTQVMFDSDIAMLYQVDTKRINEAVKRNPERFPHPFCFQLTFEEMECSRSQFATLNVTTSHSTRGHNVKYLPYVFSEQGIAMLSTVLHSEAAIQVSISIMNAFVEMRDFYMDNSLLLSKIDMLEKEQNEFSQFQIETNSKFDEVFKFIHEHSISKTKFFKEGSYFDALISLVDNIESATKEIILIDNYVNLHSLNILSKKKKDVSLIVITHPKTSLTQDDIDAFNKEYGKLTLLHTESLHDRYLIVDNNEYFTIGQSAKDLGKKGSGIVEITDSLFINVLISEVNRIISKNI